MIDRWRPEFRQTILDVLEASDGAYGQVSQWCRCPKIKIIDTNVGCWRECWHCGKPFIPTHHAQEYCNKRCRKRAAEKRRYDRHRERIGR